MFLEVNLLSLVIPSSKPPPVSLSETTLPHTKRKKGYQCNAKLRLPKIRLADPVLPDI